VSREASVTVRIDDTTPAGLSGDEARARLGRFGPNALPASPPASLASRVLAQFRSPLIYILLVALAVDVGVWIAEGAAGLPLESLAIALILGLNAGLGVYQESKAEAALAELRELATSAVWVLRDGHYVHLPATEVVPGDVVRVEAGDRVPADGTLVESQGLLVDESVLTGESVPVDKAAAEECFSGTLVARGKGVLEVARTGAASAMGRVAGLIGSIKAAKTPLERRLADFGAQIARWVLALAGIIAVVGIVAEGPSNAGHVMLFTVALAVSAVPEGLPAVLTLTLALGVERMARRKAVVRRLSAVEALGSVTVIATDKTGTLTENRMQVRAVEAADADVALLAMALANDAEIATGAGDPLEVALLEYAGAHGLDPRAAALEHPRRSVLPFDSAHKYMRVTVEDGGRLVSYLKGAPEALVARSRLGDDERRVWEAKAERYASEGYRVLALARRDGEGDDALTMLGLAMLWDPPRAEVPGAIRRAREAGIRVLMVTGDHPATALAIAREVGIDANRVVTGSDLDGFSSEAFARAAVEANVFARVAPEHKLRLVEALSAAGEVVAVTGDGVNDAPALKRADVGVSMGERGSDVAREVSDLVLLDDNFATIVSAIDEGRNIYENIQKFIRFLFATNLGEVLIVVAGLVGAIALDLRDDRGALWLPLTAVQLLWLNIVTDGPPALALGLDRNAAVMAAPPRDPRSKLLDATGVRFVVVAGVVKALVAGALLVLLPRYGYSLEATRSVVFLYATIGQLVYAYPARRLHGAPGPNAALHAAVVFGVALQILTVTTPWLRALLGLAPLDLAAFAVLAVAVAASWGAAEAFARRASGQAGQRGGGA
jgi:Ca2+-transporting ATPase